MDAVELALLANGGFEWHEQHCRCDPSVNQTPCEYCAIHTALTRAKRFALQETGGYFAQTAGTCCFVYAVANCLLYLRQPVKALDVAMDVAKCRTGSTIDHKGVIAYFGAPLVEASYDAVLECGGVLNIMHPIFNGHSLFVFPEAGGLTLVNSWLGPNVIRGVGRDEVLRWVSDSVGSHYRIERC